MPDFLLESYLLDVSMFSLDCFFEVRLLVYFSAELGWLERSFSITLLLMLTTELSWQGCSGVFAGISLQCVGSITLLAYERSGCWVASQADTSTEFCNS